MSAGIDWEARRAADYAVRFEDMALIAAGEGDRDGAERFLRYARYYRRLEREASASSRAEVQASASVRTMVAALLAGWFGSGF